LIYVSAGTPEHIQTYLESESRERGFTLISRKNYLAPNHARNLALPFIKTKYIVFVDNDILVTPGWLDALVQCADETGAALVGPLYLIGEPEEACIHMAGGSFHLGHIFADTKISDVPCALVRRTVDFLEFHCVLVRKDVFDQLGPLDPELPSLHEHVDLALAVQKTGGAVFLEPAAVISYLAPPPFDPSDLAFYMVRWSDCWNWKSVSHFGDKWATKRFHSGYTWGRNHRRLAAGAHVGNGTLSTPTRADVGARTTQAELTMAAFIAAGREFFDVRLGDGDGSGFEQMTSADPYSVLTQLPGFLEKAVDQHLDLFIRPVSPDSSVEDAPPQRQRPPLIRVDNLAASHVDAAAAHAFLTVNTGTDRYQCWFAIDSGKTQPAHLRQAIGSRASVGVGHDVSLRVPGSKHIAAGGDGAHNGSPDVKLVDVRLYQRTTPETFFALCPTEGVSIALDA